MKIYLLSKYSLNCILSKTFSSRALLRIGILSIFFFIAAISHATSYVWNGSNGDWTNPANWSPNGIPGATDDVAINSGTVTLTSNTSVNNMTLVGTINGGFDLMINGNLTLSGLLDNAGLTTVNGTMSWTDGKVGNDAGTVSGTLTVQGMITISTGAIHQLNKKTLNANGGVTHNEGNLRMGFASTLNIPVGQTFSANSPSGTGITNGTGAGNIVNNNGTFIRTTSGSYIVGHFQSFNNDGLVQINNGSISLQGGGTQTGTFDLSASTTLFLGRTSSSPVTHNLNNAVFTGTGTVFQNGGTVNLNSGAGVFQNLTILEGTFNSVPSLTIAENLSLTGLNASINGNCDIIVQGNLLLNGALANNGITTVMGTMTWNEGIIGNNTGTATGTLNIEGMLTVLSSSNHDLYKKTVNANGGVTHNEGNLRMGFASTLNIPVGQTFSANSPSGTGITNGTGAGNTVNNNGTFIRNISGNYIVGHFQSFNNDGLVQINNGSISLQGGGTQTGTFDLSAGTTLFLGRTSSSPVTHNLNNAVFTGTGTVFQNGGTVNLNSGAGVFQDLTVFEGTFNSIPDLTILSNLSISGPNAFITGDCDITVSGNFILNGFLANDGNTTVAGTMTWNQGKVGGNNGDANGILTVNGLVSVLTSNTHFINGKILNANGGLTHLQGIILMGYVSTLNIPTGQTFLANSPDGTGIQNGNLGGNVINNAGAFIRNAAGNYIIGSNESFHNTGSVEVILGSLTLQGNGNHTGSFNLAAGTTLFLGSNASTCNFNGATITGTGTISHNAGVTNINSGAGVLHALTIVEGSFNSTPDLTILTNLSMTTPNGLIGGNFNLTVNGNVSLNGFLANNGNTTVLGHLTWNEGKIGNNDGSASGSVTVEGMINILTSNSHFINKKTINANGGVTHSQGTIFMGHGGTLNIPAGEFLFANSPNGTGIKNGSGPGNSVNIAGTLLKMVSGSYTLENTVSCNNSGHIQVDAGTLTLGGNGIHTGTFHCESGSNIIFGTSKSIITNDINGSVFTGQGTYQLAGKFLNFNSGVPEFHNFIIQHSGILNSLLDVTVHNDMTIIPGGVLAGDKNLTVEGNLSLGGFLANNGTVTVEGNMTWLSGGNGGAIGSADGTATGDLIVNGLTTITTDLNHLLNKKTFYANGGITHFEGNIRIGFNGTLNIPAGQTYLANTPTGKGFDNGNGTGTFNNTGIFKRTVSGDFFTGNSNTFNNNGIVQPELGSFTFNGALHNAGELKGNGLINLNGPFTNTGIINPGLSPGILTINNVQPLTSTSTLVIEMNGGNAAGHPTGHDQLRRSGDIILNGTMTVTETAPVPDGLYTVLLLNSGTISGTFTTINLPHFTFLEAITSTEIILRKENPTITCPNNITVNNETGLCLSSVGNIDPVVTPAGTDFFYELELGTSGTGMGTASGQQFNVGTTSVTYTVTHAQHVFCSFNVTVLDNELPEVICPGNITTLTDPEQCTAEIDYTITSNDNCPDASVQQITGLPSGSLFPLGTTINQFLITDASGNTATCSFQVTVNPRQEICNGLDDDCDGFTDDDDDSVIGQLTWYEDSDNDGFGNEDVQLHKCVQPLGYVSNNEDCDDSDELINPDAPEVCNSVDDDCDGLLDDDDPGIINLPVWYEDADEDGYGNEESTIASCNQPAGYVDNPDDCDDTNENIQPDAVETCNNIDDDCDGLTDDEDPSISGQTTWFLDADDDGYGDAGTILLSCNEPPGYVLNDDDCDDTQPNIHPGAGEICNSIDDDCDGLIDDADPGVTGQDTWFADSDGDGFGDLNESLNACTQPPGYIDNNLDCNDSNPNIHPDATELCNQMDDDCDGLVDDDDPGIVGQTTWYQDADGDNFGNDEITILSCSQPHGYVLDNTDCDDTNPAINGGAADICNGIDDDCDGDVDDINGDGVSDCNLSPDYVITLQSGEMIITDLAGNGEILQVTQDGNNIRFLAEGRTYQYNNGPVINMPALISMADVNLITINTDNGYDRVNFGSFSIPFPSLIVNGGSSGDIIMFLGDIVFKETAFLDLNLVDDHQLSGLDMISIRGNSNLRFTNGNVVVKVNSEVSIAQGASIETVNGNIYLEGNLAGSDSNIQFTGISNSGLIQSSGNGSITLFGRGNGDQRTGVSCGGKILTNTGRIIITGHCHMFSYLATGIQVHGEIKSSFGLITLTGSGSGGVSITGKVTAVNDNKITITGTANAITNIYPFTSGVRINPTAIIASVNGNLNITGKGGGVQSQNYGIMIEGSVNITGNGQINLDGEGGFNGNYNYGVFIKNGSVSGGAGHVNIMGKGGTAGSFNHGVALLDGVVNKLQHGFLNITGVGGPNGNNNCGVWTIGSKSLIKTNTAIINITGTGGGQPGTTENIGVNLDETFSDVIVNGQLVSSSGRIITDANVSIVGIEGHGGIGIRTRGTISAKSTTLLNSNSMQLFGKMDGTLLYINQLTDSCKINIGSIHDPIGGPLSISDSELDKMKVFSIRIGNQQSGQMHITSLITHDNANYMHLTGEEITVAPGSIIAKNTTLVLIPTVGNIKPFFTNIDAEVRTIGTHNRLAVNIDGPIANTSYSQLKVKGKVNLQFSALDFTGNYIPTYNETFTIVDNDGNEAILVPFNLPQGATIPNFMGSGLNATISYTGGTGNDVVITVQPPPAGIAVMDNTSFESREDHEKAKFVNKEEKELKIYPLIPNPQSTSSNLQVLGLEDSPFEIQVYNLQGNLVASMQEYQNDWNMSTLTAGTYFYRIIIKKESLQPFVYTGQLVLVNE